MTKKKKWWYIEAKDNGCCGYAPGKTEKDACRVLGLDVKRCKVLEVEKTRKGFKWRGSYIQLKLKI